MTVMADHRVPASARSATELMLVWSTKDGPVNIGWPPPITFLLVKYSHRFGRVRAFTLVSVPPDRWSSAVRPQQHRAASPVRRSPPTEPGHRHPATDRHGRRASCSPCRAASLPVPPLR